MRYQAALLPDDSRHNRPDGNRKSFGGPGRIRTRNRAVMSGLLYP